MELFDWTSSTLMADQDVNDTLSATDANCTDNSVALLLPFYKNVMGCYLDSGSCGSVANATYTGVSAIEAERRIVAAHACAFDPTNTTECAKLTLGQATTDNCTNTIASCRASVDALTYGNNTNCASATIEGANDCNDTAFGVDGCISTFYDSEMGDTCSEATVNASLACDVINTACENMYAEDVPDLLNATHSSGNKTACLSAFSTDGNFYAYTAYMTNITEIANAFYCVYFSEAFCTANLSNTLETCYNASVACYESMASTEGYDFASLDVSDGACTAYSVDYYKYCWQEWGFCASEVVSTEAFGVNSSCWLEENFDAAKTCAVAAFETCNPFSLEYDEDADWTVCYNETVDDLLSCEEMGNATSDLVFSNEDACKGGEAKEPVRQECLDAVQKIWAAEQDKKAAAGAFDMCSEDASLCSNYYNYKPYTEIELDGVPGVWKESCEYIDFYPQLYNNKVYDVLAWTDYACKNDENRTQPTLPEKTVLVSVELDEKPSEEQQDEICDILRNQIQTQFDLPLSSIVLMECELSEVADSAASGRRLLNSTSWVVQISTMESSVVESFTTAVANDPDAMKLFSTAVTEDVKAETGISVAEVGVKQDTPQPTPEPTVAPPPTGKPTNSATDEPTPQPTAYSAGNRLVPSFIVLLSAVALLIL